MKNFDVQLYGAERCHKTQYYKEFLKNKKVEFTFFDVEQNEVHSEALRNLYTNRKLNFPTLLLNGKKLRNPSDKDLEKWLNKLK